MAEPQPIIEEPDDDITVEANYRKEPDTDNRITELSIVNAKANQPFETVFVEPDETTTEVIVDADGTKRIIVKKLHRTVVRHQESHRQQQHFTTLSTIEGDVPVTQSFSQVTLKGQQSSTTVASGDGKSATLTSQQYGGKIVSGAPGGEINVQEFQSEPESHYTYVGGAIRPDEVEVQGIKLHEGDITLVDNQSNKLVPVGEGNITYEGNEIHTSSSSVRAVVQQVTRRIIRKTRRIIRKTVVIDGKEHVTEEIVEEPEEIEVTEEGIPRVSINVTRTEDGRVVEETLGQEPIVIPQEPTVKVQETTITQEPETERYVVEQPIALPVDTAPNKVVIDFLDNERLVTSSIDSSTVVKAPSGSSTPPNKKERKKKKDKKTPDDESVSSTEADKVVSVTVVETTSPPTKEQKSPSPVSEKTYTIEEPKEKITVVEKTPKQSPVEAATITKTTTVIKTPEQIETVTISPEKKESPVETTITKTTTVIQSPEQQEKISPTEPTTATEIIETTSKSPIAETITTKTTIVSSDDKPWDTVLKQQTIDLLEAEKKPEKLELQTISKIYTQEPEQSKTTTPEVPKTPTQAVTEVTTVTTKVSKSETPKEEPKLKSVTPDVSKTPKDESKSVSPTKSETPKEEPKSERITPAPSAPPEGDVSPKMSSLTQNFILTEQLHDPTSPVAAKSPEESAESPKGKKKRKFSSSKKKLSPGTPRSQSPVDDAQAENIVVEETKIITSKTVDPQQGYEIDLTLEETQKMSDIPKLEKTVEIEKPLGTAQTVEIELSLEEKQKNRDIKTPKVAVSMKIEEDLNKTAEILQKDINVQLPRETVEASSPIVPKHEEEPATPSDFSGRSSKKKKKHKPPSRTPTEEKSSSMEIDIPEDSHVSEETPKPSQDIFEPVTDSEEGDSEKGYEAERTTVDESLADDDDQDKKKRRKKKRKQKIKVKESEDSQVPQSITDSSPIGDSVAFTDDEPSQPRPTEEPKKSKKRKSKGKRKQSESEQEMESETVQEAKDEEIQSPNESYHTISTQSEPGTVKVIEEQMITSPTESPRVISSEIVTTVPVLEGVITQENIAQTSPVNITADFIANEKALEKPQGHETSAQTSPEVPKETLETSIQTSEEVVVKPETTESTTQIELTTSETLTQTTPPKSPEEKKVTVETRETSSSPIKTKVTEVATATTPKSISPEVPKEERPKSEMSMQTTVITTEEVSMQTKSPEVVETTEISTQIQPEVTDQQTSPKSMTPVVTSPEPSAPLEPISSTPKEELPIPEPSPVVTSPEPSAPSEPISSTLPEPSPVPSLSETTPSSSEYEVLVKTTIIYPSDTSESTVTATTQDTSKSSEDTNVEDGSEYSSDEYSLQVEVDGKPLDKNSVSTFLETERESTDPKKPKRKRKKNKKPTANDSTQEIEKDLFSAFKQQEGDHLDPKDLYSDVARKGSRPVSPIVPEDTEVFTKVYTDINEEQIRIHDAPEESWVNVSITLPQKPEITPEDIEIITKDVLKTKHGKPSTFKVDSMLTEAEIKSKHEPQDTTTTVELSIQTGKSMEEKPIKKVEEIKTPEPDDSTSSEDVIFVESVQLKPVKPGTKPTKKEAAADFLQQEKAVSQPKQSDVFDAKPKTTPSKPKGKSKHVSSVTIEEVQSPPRVADTPLTPGASDAPLSPPNYPIITWKPAEASKQTTEKQLPIVLQDVDIRWSQAQALERFKNLQNAKKTTHLSDVLYLATLNEIVTDETVEQRNNNVQVSLDTLQRALEKRDVVVIQQTIITTVETITTWLETIEYRIYVNRQQTADGPSKERVQEFNNLRDEISNIESKVDQLQNVMSIADNIYNEEDRERMRSYIESLQQQVKVIEEVTEENELLAASDLKRWDEFVNGVENVGHVVRNLYRQLSDLKESDASPQTKLNELDKLENTNRSHILKAVHLKATAKGLMRDFPTREIPNEVYAVHDLTKQLEQLIITEREKALQFLSLADDYEQTLKEFSQIIIIAEALVESSISVRNLEHLEDEMQNHRKFFVNLSHCRAILESLEENLDSETRANHSELHRNLYDRAKVILDKSAGRFQQMSLAASRWTILEQGTKEEIKWLQVAQQRIPDLSNVTSSDYDRYLNLYQALAYDIDQHHTKLLHLNDAAQRLQELVSCPGLEDAFTESLEIIVKLQDDVNNKLERLLAFKETWTTYNILGDKLEAWLRDAQIQLKKIDVSSGPRVHLRQFWELKAQHEVNNGARLNATQALEKSLQVVPVADELIQRKFHADLQSQWNKVSDKINDIQSSILDTISASDKPVNEKLALLEQELADLKVDVDNLQGIIKNEEELDLYVERLQIMSSRMDTIQNELGRLGLLSADESEKVGSLLALSKRLELVIAEELEGGIMLKERLLSIDKGISRVRRKHSEFGRGLDQCETAEKLGSEAVEKAVTDCNEIGEELVTLWQDLMGLRQLLHTLPMRLKITVSPVKVEREISQLQDDHTALEKRCGQLLALLRSRLSLWQRFERQLEMVQQSVQEADFMMELLTVQGTVDYERLRKATERLESVSGDLVTRETLVEELKEAAKPLTDSCSSEVSAKVQAAVQEAVTAYSTTCTQLKDLCTKYGNAAELWKQYREATDLVREWTEKPMESVDDLEPEEAVARVKICEETYAAHKKRLGEIQQLVSNIASAVGLDAKALLGGEVDALGKRLEDVRESLTTLADVADAKSKTKKERDDEMLASRTYLTSVQRSLDSLDGSDPDSDPEEKMVALRDHLLSLSKTEGQIRKIKDQTLEISTTRTETSVLEILELWQQVFRETFQQYHRLSTRLVKNEDGAAALKLWQEYLVNVQQFLQGTIPGDYHSLSDHQHLCQVHQNLLTTQQNVLKPLENKDNLVEGLVESTVMEQFNSLTNVHNETLSRIMERHIEVQKRLDAWEQYRKDQQDLLTWLKNIEKEKEKMQLRYMHIRRIPKLIHRIEGFLERVPSGYEQSDNLQIQQNHLLQFCDDALATSIRIEHVAIRQRISNLEAGLQTWREFLVRIRNLVQMHEERANKVQAIFDGIQETIHQSTKNVPATHAGINSNLEYLQRSRNRLSMAIKELEQLGVSQEQLKECLSHPDTKTINQKMWLLWHQHGDLEHQLAALCHQYEEKLGTRSIFDARHSRFIAWADDIERRLEQDSDEESALQDPKELLRKLESELQAELTLKDREYKWLVRTGNDLVDGCGDEYSDVTAKQILQTKTVEVQNRWEKLENLAKSRANKIHDMMQTMMTLEERLAQIRAWLAQIEAQQAKPLVFEGSSKDVLDRKIQEHDKLRKSIENESGNIGDVFNLCELFLSDADTVKAHFTVENITAARSNVEKRWKVVCGQSAERKRKINYLWKLLLDIIKLSEEQEQWLNDKEFKLKEFDKPIKDLDKDEIQALIYLIENKIKDIETQTPNFQILEQTYSKLVTDGGLEPENVQELTSKARVVITRWHNLLPKATNVLERLKAEMMPFKEFSLAHEDAVVALSNIDAQLTELQHLSADKLPLKERLSKLEGIERILKSQTPNLDTADRLGLKIMKKSKKSEVSKIQEMIDEYQILCKDIYQRITVIKEEITTEIKRRPQEVDESVQVETLKFERDSAVQVNTLPPQLQRMTSISAKDAYLVQISSALLECRADIADLEELVRKEIPKQGSPELPASSKKIAKASAKCQASVELVRHLHDLLTGECDATAAEAGTDEVEDLSERFDMLLISAKEKEKKLRDLRSTEAYNLLCQHEAGRLLCPLCTKRNWAQLDNDLWRLEKWLQVAEATQKSLKSPPKNIEQLEDVIQDHREFLLDLDSHRSIVTSLNIVGTHLADHTEDTERAVELRKRLEADNKKWEAIRIHAAQWAIQLQRALMDNQQFHAIVGELCAWLEKNERKIKVTEPVDLTQPAEHIEAKYRNFMEIRADLERCEPRVLSLQEAANQLLRAEDAPEGSSAICKRLTELRLKLQSLIRLTAIYTLKLGAVLGKDPNEHYQGGEMPQLQNIGYDLKDLPDQEEASTSAQGDTTHNGTSDEINPSTLRRGCRFLGRVVRASLPIQVGLMLLLGAASFVPYTEDDYSCSIVNSIANHLTPTLRYMDGTPPI